ncbi:DUF4272 domain-containing protein [Sphingomonas sp.]|uniref:DUF4272 domain-containing protein n=1 Tax=Sphingomonas sp. TaxID=28214 RepID=UPI0025E27F92|nr:DUF4272 domain-containing protein [Sphingomonas sp.]
MERFDLGDLRSITLQELATAGIHPPPHFPLLDEPEQRSSESAVERLLCLHAVAAASYGFSKRNARAWLEQEGLWSKLEGDEERFLLSPVGQTALFQWQVQGIYILAWALGVIEAVNLWKPCPDDLVLKLPNVKVAPSTTELRGSLALRSLEEIAGAADLAYCLHWAVRDARLSGRAAPGDIEETEIMERRRALEWLISDEDWYAISLDT